MHMKEGPRSGGLSSAAAAARPSPGARGRVVLEVVRVLAMSLVTGPSTITQPALPFSYS